MHAILTPVGSAGDVNPFVMIGRELRRRGHRVTLLSPDVFASSAARADVEFVSTGSADEFQRVTKNPDLWDPRRGAAVVFGEVLRHMRQTYALLEQLYEPGETIVVGHSLSLFTRVFEETHRVAASTIHLSPTVLRSDFEQPVLPSGHDISARPRWIKRLLWWALDRFAIDRLLAPKLNAWRAELGLPPVARLFKSWVNSPQRMLALFPPWFAQPQPDWPAQLRLTGFVLSDDTCAPPADGGDIDRLNRFLCDGEPPVVFAPGSANRHATAFFHTAIGATAALGRRALLVSPYREHLPSSLPAHVGHVPYASFSTLFPQAAAVVHHGGIGTSAQALAAGVPQLVMPMGFDQPDNAARLLRLDVARVVYPKYFTPPTVAAALDQVLSSDAIASACALNRTRIHSEGALARSCDFLEECFRGRRR
jgi:UDP:flavonoid glycosyltransferase YjiC (YdhE family)